MGILRFHGAPEAILRLEPGDVIVAGKSERTPKGLIRGVVSVTNEGNETVVETLPVPLPLAFKRLHAKLAREGIDLANLDTPVSGSPSKQPNSKPSYSAGKVVDNKRVFDKEVYNIDQNVETKDDQFLVHAELEGHVDLLATVDSRLARQ